MDDYDCINKLIDQLYDVDIICIDYLGHHIADLRAEDYKGDSSL